MIDIGTIARWGTVLRVVIPALVAVDTVHSFYKVSQLYKARLKEWADEESQQLHAEVVELLRHVAQRCGRRDKEFWPATVTLAIRAQPTPGGAAAVPSTAAPGAAAAPLVGQDAAGRAALSGQPSALAQRGQAAEEGVPALEHVLADAAAFFQCLGLAPLEMEPCPSAGPAAAPHPSPSPTGPSSKAGTAVAAAAIAAAPSSPALKGSPLAEAGAGAGVGPIMLDPYGSEPEKLPQQPASGTCWAWAPTAGSLQAWGSQALAAVKALAQPAGVALSVRSGLAQQYSRQCGRLDEWLSAAAEGLLRRLEASVPWPQASLTRRSALRYRVEWHGLRWPDRPAKEAGLELQLNDHL